MNTQPLIPIYRITKPTILTQRELIRNFQLFSEYLRWMKGFGSSPMPDGIHQLLWTMEHSLDLGYDDLLLMCYRGMGKTTLLCIPYIAWRLAREPWLRVAVVSGVEERAKAILGGIVAIMKAMPEGMYKFAKKPTTERIWLDCDQYSFGEINASATSVPVTGGSSVGARTDVLLFDDAYNIENADKPTTAKRIEDKINAILALFGERPPQIIMPGTPVMYGDMFHRRVKSDPNGVFRIPAWPDSYPLPEPPISRQAAYQLWKDCFWPRNTTPEKIRLLFNKTSPSFIAAQYMVKPQLQSYAYFDMDNVTIAPPVEPDQVFWDKANKTGGAMVVAIDPGTGLKHRQDGDDTVMLVVGYERDSGTWHVYDGWGVTDHKPSDVAREWHRLVHKWQVRAQECSGVYLPTYVETIGSYISILADLRYQDIPSARVMCQRKRVNKDDKIIGLVGAIVNNRRLVIHRCPVADKLLAQIAHYGAELHDDYIDALALGIMVLADHDENLDVVMESLPTMTYEDAREIRDSE